VSPDDAVEEKASHPRASESDEPQFTLARLLDMREGPEILRHEHYVIAGALAAEHEKLKANPKAGEKTMTLAAAKDRIEKWLARPVEVDNSLAEQGDE